MSRPQKEGLNYFPCDIDIFDDDKLFDVQNEYGPLGEIIYMRLLCLIYKNGYYYKYESLDKLASLLVRSIGNKWVRDKQTVVQVIPFLAKCNLFSSELMQENVLTSASIQKRYLKATERRQSTNNKPYWLLGEVRQSRANVHKNGINVDNNSINVDNNSINVDNNATKKSKVKKSKVVGVLTSDGYNELCDKIGKSDCDYYLERVKAFLKTHPTATFDVKSIILKWHREDAKKESSTKNKDYLTRNYTEEDLDSLFSDEDDQEDI